MVPFDLPRTRAVPLGGFDLARSGGLLIAFALVTACVPAVKTSVAEILPGAVALPAMAWDHRPEASIWTRATLDAVAAKDAVLAERVPGDVAQWCPAYEKASLADRRAFWAGLISTVGRYESSWNPNAAGGGGRYIGVMQISPRSAGNYGCEATSKTALKDGAANLSCSVEILAYQVGRDGLVAGEAGNRGIGRDWMPLRKTDKRQAMALWMRGQSYCGGQG
jgi:soluble lytic murein transglycosylase-like protein